MLSVAITPAVSSDDVAAARKLLRDVISDTPVLHSRVLSETVAGPVYLKCENMQRTGSFKVRGAYHRIARLSDAERARGVVAASAGNHAQGVAFAAALLGCAATVVMPQGAPLPKVQATCGYGAAVILHGSNVEDALTEALEFAERTGAVFIHPYDHPDIVAGQGTLGFEIIEQCPQVRTVVVPVGGGGLAAGIAVAIKGLDPAVRIVGVQAEAVAPYPGSLAAGHPVPVSPSPTMADGIAVARPGDIPFGILSGLAERVVTVSEESLSRGAAAVPGAGQAGGGARGRGRGGRPARAFARLHPAGGGGAIRRQHRPAAAVEAAPARPVRGRALPGVPLPAARSSGVARQTPCDLADLGANVLEVWHERLAPRLHVDEVEVVLQVETRGPEHCGEVIDALRAAGYTLAFG